MNFKISKIPINENVHFAMEEDGVVGSRHLYMQGVVQVNVGALSAMKWWGQAIRTKDVRPAVAKAIIDPFFIFNSLNTT